MQLFARHSLVPRPLVPGGPVLLLEGDWPAGERDERRWSLDAAIDARYGWIDALAADYAAFLGKTSAEGPSGAGATLAYLNALGLRYFLVRLLRILTFLDRLRQPDDARAIQVHLEHGGDEEYSELLSEWGRARGTSVAFHWVGATAPHSDSPSPRQNPLRRWFERVEGRAALREPANGDSRPRIVLCGNPQLLDPVCDELLGHGCRVWWLWRQFAFRCWWRWRKRGVRLLCEARGQEQNCISEDLSLRPLQHEGVDLTPAVRWWLRRRAGRASGAGVWTLDHVETLFEAVRPGALVLDEDATPFKRAAVAAARRLKAVSLVVQHGAPCVSFGFAPLAADRIAIWGDSSRRQLLEWGLRDEQIAIAGSPAAETSATRSSSGRHRGAGGPRILLLATIPPSDSRPDSVRFHLTRSTHDEMLRMVCAASARLSARLTVKLHPRTADEAPFRRALAQWPVLRARLLRRSCLHRLLAESDCVVSCASTAGIEAALAGAPVVQLLPAGSADILSPSRWGLLGSAREQGELERLLEAALARGWRQQPPSLPDVIEKTGVPAARRVAQIVLGTLREQSGSPEPASLPLEKLLRSELVWH